MARWNSGARWDSGILWGPAPPVPTQNRPKTKTKTKMKRKPFFPKAISERPEWLHNFALQLAVLNAILGMDATAVADIIKDAKYLEHAYSAWITWVRELGPTGTAALEVLSNGVGSEPYLLPEFIAPPPPAGVVAVPPGALRRILAFVKLIKANKNYTDAIGQQLGIIGAEESAEHLVPVFTVKMERGGGCQCVKFSYAKYDNPGVVIWGRRGGGEREQLAVSLISPWLDERPLLVPGQPELREYWLQFFDGNKPVGPLTDLVTVTVAP